MRVLGRRLCMDPTSINTAEGGESNGNELREKARRAILARRLPKQEPTATFGGYGYGASCAICGEPVAPHQVEFEIEFAPDAQSDAGPGALSPACSVFHSLAGGVPQHYGEPHGDPNRRRRRRLRPTARNT